MNILAIRILVGLAALVGAVLGWHHYIEGVRSEADKAGYSRRDAEQKTADNKALREALADVARLNAALQGVSDDARKQKQAAAAAAVGARDAGERLRDVEARLRAALGQRACPGAPTASGSDAADATERMLSELSRRAHEAEERVARFADESRIAGLACQRAYESLRGKP